MRYVIEAHEMLEISNSLGLAEMHLGDLMKAASKNQSPSPANAALGNLAQVRRILGAAMVRAATAEAEAA